MKVGLVFAVTLLSVTLLSIPLLAQTDQQAEVFSAKDVQGKLAALEQAAKPSGSSGTKLGDYGSHSIALSVRNASGGAEIHAHYDDVFLVTQGRATLITGGTVVDPKTGADGEIKGSKVQNGASQVISAGDVVHIPAGVPHQLMLAPGETYSAIVIKVRES